MKKTFASLAVAALVASAAPALADLTVPDLSYRTGSYAANGIPYVTEVCPRTPNDRKGGHLAVRRSDGRLVLRDSTRLVCLDLRKDDVP